MKEPEPDSAMVGAYLQITDGYTSFNTVGGLLLEELSHLPKSGDKLQWQNFIFEVLDRDGARIDKVLVIAKK